MTEFCPMWTKEEEGKVLLNAGGKIGRKNENEPGTKKKTIKNPTCGKRMRTTGGRPRLDTKSSQNPGRKKSCHRGRKKLTSVDPDSKEPQ